MESKVITRHQVAILLGLLKLHSCLQICECLYKSTHLQIACLVL